MQAAEVICRSCFETIAPSAENPSLICPKCGTENRTASRFDLASPPISAQIRRSDGIDGNLPVFTEACYKSIPVSSSDGTAEYYVDLTSYTCTCPDFVERRSEQPMRSATRACKHICRVLLRETCKSRLNPLLLSMVENSVSFGTGIHPGWLILDDNDNVVFVSFPARDWCNIFAPVRTKRLIYERYGYNIAERRWSYGEAPIGARSLRQYLHGQLLSGTCTPSTLAITGEALPPPQSQGDMTCRHCGSHTIRKIRGLRSIGEVCICIVLVFLFLIPGIIFYIYVESLPYCSACGRRGRRR
jgi:predicted RNA-binding Zn-ribbon protein involved in translation (DUF1610 family)